MEAKLDSVLEAMMQSDNTIGALISDSQGLSYGGEKSFKLLISFFIN